MAAPQLLQDRYVYVPIPGVDGVTLVCDREQSAVEPELLRGAAVIIAHWLRSRTRALQLREVRGALRRLHEPRLLGDTELAHTLFNGVDTAEIRGNTLHTLLVKGIQRLDPGPDAPPKSRRGSLILQHLYVQRRPRNAIAEALGLSERHYQRELKRALVALTETIDNQL